MRFDKDFLQYIEMRDEANKQMLVNKYESVLPAFGKVIINNSDIHSTLFFNQLYQYFSDTTLMKIYKQAEIKFENIEGIEHELSKANQHLWQIYPGKQLPKLCMHVSGLKQNVIVTDSLISISIDKYLGEDFPFYKDYFYDYQRSQMKPEFISRDYLRAYILSSLFPESKNQDLVSNMIREGKCLHTLALLMPEFQKNDLIGYSKKQMKWCEENERAIWRTTIARKFLYNNEYLIISKYMDEAPYTSLISPLSPGKIGAWIGWKIVDAYAKNNPKVDMATILQMDEHKLLQDSRYNP